MDTTDPVIQFDENGECNYCKMFDEMWKALPKGEEAQRILNEKMKQIKKHGRGKKYDCLLGLSGGIDSSNVAHIAQQYKLRVLLVHCNNGFDSEISQNNMNKIIDATGYDMINYQLPLDEFYDLCRAFLFASVIDTDIPADHAIVSIVWKTAIQNGLQHVLSGGNQATEFYIPRAWTYANKNDLTNLKNIHRRFGRVKLKQFPVMSAFKKIWRRNVYRLKFTYPLNFIPYTKHGALKKLKEEFGFQPYGHKHCENIFSRFYQCHILPTKFGVDKRKAHLSALIRIGEVTREKALIELTKWAYAPTSIYGEKAGKNKQFTEDKAFILEKLGLTEEQFLKIMQCSPIRHDYYGTDEWIYNCLDFLHTISARIRVRTRLRRLYAKLT